MSPGGGWGKLDRSADTEMSLSLDGRSSPRSLTPLSKRTHRRGRMFISDSDEEGASAWEDFKTTVFTPPTARKTNRSPEPPRKQTRRGPAGDVRRRHARRARVQGEGETGGEGQAKAAALEPMRPEDEAALAEERAKKRKKAAAERSAAGPAGETVSTSEKLQATRKMTGRRPVVFSFNVTTVHRRRACCHSPRNLLAGVGPHPPSPPEEPPEGDIVQLRRVFGRPSSFVLLVAWELLPLLLELFLACSLAYLAGARTTGALYSGSSGGCRFGGCPRGPRVDRRRYRTSRNPRRNQRGTLATMSRPCHPHPCWRPKMRSPPRTCSGRNLRCRA